MSSRRAIRRRQRCNSCEGKRRFAHRWQAAMAARSLFAATGDRCTPYRCGFCGWWHYGHTPGLHYYK